MTGTSIAACPAEVLHEIAVYLCIKDTTKLAIVSDADNQSSIQAVVEKVHWLATRTRLASTPTRLSGTTWLYGRL